jgi:uncharacterized membrane protein
MNGYKCKDDKGNPFYPYLPINSSQDLKLKYKIYYSKYILGKNLPNNEKFKVNQNYFYGKTEGDIILNSKNIYFSLDLGFVEAATDIAPTIKPVILDKPPIIVTPRTGGQNINYNYLYLFVFSISILLVNKYKSKLFKK